MRRQRNIQFWLRWLVIACLVPAVCATFWTIASSYRHERAALQRASVATARALMHAVDRDLQGALAAIGVLATSPDIDEGDFATFHRQARQVLKAEIGNGVVLATPEGQQIVNTLKEFGDTLPRSGLPDFLKAVAQAKKPLVSDYYVGATSGVPQVAVGVPVIRDGEVKYVLTMAIEPDRLGQILTEQRVASDEVAAIIDRNGTYVARTMNPNQLVGTKAIDTLLQDIGAGAEGIIQYTTREGVAVTGGFTRSASGWTVVMGIPDSRFAANLQESLWLSVMIAIAMFSVALLLARLVNARIVRSVRALVSHDENYRIEIKEVAEVADELKMHTEGREQAERAKHALAIEKEAAEQSNDAKSQFLTLMSHELRTPLHGVLGYAQLLDGEFYGPLTAKQKEFAASILHSGNHLLELINDVLELSKIESGRLTVSLERVDLLPVLKSVIANLHRMADKHDVTLSAGNFGLGMPPVLADHIRLAQCLLNFGSNAIKYNRPGGSVTLVCSVVRERVRIAVTDTGAGIPEDRQAEVFQPFNRLGAEQTAVEGTGVGLALTRKLIGLMDGGIGFESETGKGSTFWIELPIYAASPQALETRSVADGSTAGGATLRAGFSILYVEDNPANLGLMRDVIATMGDVQLLEAADGASGLASAKESRPDVIVLDINLPDINGVALLKRIREVPELAHTPVLALSANAMPDNVKRGIEAGFFEYLTKPLDIPKFVAAVDAALARAETRSAA